VSARAALAGRLRPERDDAYGATAVVAVGCLVLTVRPLASVSADTRIVLFGVLYVTIAVASIAVPVERDTARISPTVAFGLVVGALVFVASVAGPAVPPPLSAASMPLSVLAAVAEEALFRRVAYARLARFGAVVAVGGSALLFGLVHVPAYGLAALPVDVGAGLLFGWQRWASGTWTVPAATHALANALVLQR
jgi:membrane protease YdiL (CAAX protease family)